MKKNILSAVFLMVSLSQTLLAAKCPQHNELLTKASNLSQTAENFINEIDFYAYRNLHKKTVSLKVQTDAMFDVLKQSTYSCQDVVAIFVKMKKNFQEIDKILIDWNARSEEENLFTFYQMAGSFYDLETTIGIDTEAPNMR